MDRQICSPGQDKKFTCYSSESLHKLKKLWNARHPDAKIKTTDDKEIWKALRKNMEGVCDEEACWLRQNFAKENLTPELRSYTFTPVAPEEWKDNINEWLSSVDIEQVMRQYERAHKDFIFLGPSPIDFDSKKIYGECVWEELCHFNLRKLLKRNKKKIGIVFNLDEHWKGGSHWVSLFIDVKSQKIFYFDSAGEDIPKEIQNLIDKIVSQGKSLGIDFEYDKNFPFEHQMQNTECGMYCLYFISEMIKKPSFSRFKKKRIPDKEMEQMRKQFFRI
jgi:hypothetical protein